MNNNSNINYNDEREIDLIDILGRIITKWRSVCTVTLIGLLVGCIISTVVGYYNMKKSDIEAKKVSAQKAEAVALEKLLSDEKGEDLKELADKNLIKYINIESLYQMQEDYVEKSLYKNLDATRVSKAVLTYYVDNHYTNEYPVVNTYNNIEDIMGAYGTALTSDAVCNEVIKTLGIDTEPKYIREIVTVENPSTSNMTLSIMTDNESASKAVAEYYKGVIGNITEDIIANYGDVTITLQEEQLYTESDIDVMTAQNDADSKLIDYYNQLQAIEKSMSGAQLDYFKAILAKHGLESLETDAEQHGLMYYVSKKLIVLIAIAAAFIVVAVYGVIYLFDGNVKTGDELANMSRSTLLGTVLLDNEKKRKPVLFDKWAIALIDKKVLCDDVDTMIKVITASVVQFLSSNDLKSVMLVGSDIKHADVVNKISEAVKASGYTVNTSMDAFGAEDAVTNITNSDVAVFVGEIGSSKYRKLERVLSMCHLYNKPIMGTVAIQERV